MFSAPRGAFLQGIDETCFNNSFPCLGLTLDSDGASTTALIQCLTKIRKILFQHIRSRIFYLLTVDRQWASLRKACLPHLDFYAPVSKPGPAALETINRLQRWCAAIIFRIRPYPNETPADFTLRRHQAVAGFCRRDGLWGTRLCNRFCKWVDHAERAGSHQNPPWFCTISRWHGPQWLQTQRTAHGGARTGTRRVPGRPPTRLHDAYAYAAARR